MAGAALIVREFLESGYYPEGVKDAENKAWTNPSASLVRALLVNSARTAGGTVNVYTYEKEPPCLSDTGECEPWVQPPPVVSTASLRDGKGNWLTPNYYEGFGRPILSNVLNFARSSGVSLWIKEGEFSEAGRMDSYEFPLLLADWATPLKVKTSMLNPILHTASRSMPRTSNHPTRLPGGARNPSATSASFLDPLPSVWCFSGGPLMRRTPPPRRLAPQSP